MAPAKKRKKKSSAGAAWLKFFIAFSATVLMIGLVGFGLYTYVFSGLENESPLTDRQAGIEEQSYFNEKITNIALFGIDSANGEMKGRSDSIVIVTIDEERDEIRLAAIERDTYVRIQYEKNGKQIDKMDKINHAFAYGGAELAVRTLNQNFKLDIRHYAVVDFNNMIKVIDELGGIRMEVPSNKIPEANRLIRDVHCKGDPNPPLIQKGGEQLLSGVQVLALSRVRVVGGTSGRASMHEQVLAACFARIKEKSITEYPSIAKNLLSLVQTTLTAENITSIATKVVGYSMEQEVFPLQMDWLKNNMIDGVWYRTYKEEEGKAHLIDYIYRDILP